MDELVARVSSLQAASDWWTNAVLVLGTLTAVIGLAAAVAQYKKYTSTGELSEAQKALAAHEDAEASLLAKPRERRIGVLALINASKGKPKAKLVILVQPGDPEAYAFGRRLSEFLGEAGWGHSAVNPIPNDLVASRYADWDQDIVAAMPPAVRAGGGTLETVTGVVVVSGPRTSTDEPSPASTLLSALTAALVGIPVRGAMMDTGLPPDTVRLIIAPK